VERQAHYGPNELVHAGSVRWPQVLARQFWDVLTLILIVAGLLSLVVGEWVDAATIGTIVVLNALLGFAQEWKAERALAALRQMLRPHCTVIRNGEEQTIATVEVVPGDVVVLAAGHRIPADLRLFQTVELRVDESALTGESDSVSKDAQPVSEGEPLATQACMGWMGTIVTAGRGSGIVVATGNATQFGRISSLTQGIEDETTPLQRKMAVLGRQLGIAAISVSVLVAFTGWLSGKPLEEMFFTGVSLAVAVVPEGLPAVVTLTMALGIRAMVRRRALLRRLEAAETLGAATVICSDKTGTLTQNEMTVRHVWTPDGTIDVTGVGYDPAGHFELDGQRLNHDQRDDLLQLLRTAMACNHAVVRKSDQHWEQIGEPTEAALMVAGLKAWMSKEDSAPVLREFGFTSERKRMSIVVQEGTERWVHAKGAPEIILKHCDRQLKAGQDILLREAGREAALQSAHAFAERGLRTLALARRKLPAEMVVDERLAADEVETEWVLLGIVGMLVPPRPEVPHAVATAHAAGIRVLMITGDAPETALAIARSIGLPADRAVTGPKLETLERPDLIQLLYEDVVFARTTPEHKLRIVEALQAQGEIVGMTGDGVNDAPSLKKADIGIAMGGRGTDVARGAADMVLTDDNFSSIVGAIEEGRRQYDNIQKFVRYLLSSNTGEVIAILASILMRGR